MATTRFRSPDATPPTGCYEYSTGGVTVTSRTKAGICREVIKLRGSLGLDTVGDGFRYVEEYMCPFLPNGYCTQPSQVNPLEIGDVKARTAPLFAMTCVTSDIIEERLAVCAKCDRQVTKGFCMGSCSGLMDWIYRGFTGRRVQIPADHGMGVCRHDAMFVIASASVSSESLPPREGEMYPDNCWRIGKSDTGGKRG